MNLESKNRTLLATGDGERDDEDEEQRAPRWRHHHRDQLVNCQIKPQRENRNRSRTHFERAEPPAGALTVPAVEPPESKHAP